MTSKTRIAGARVARRNTLLSIIFLALSAGAGGCLSESGATCSLDSDCDKGLLCHPFDKICVPAQCTADGECSVPDAAKVDDIGDTAQAAPEDTGKPTDTTPPSDIASCDAGAAAGTLAFKVEALAVGENGQPGSGLDVDGKPGTCAPEDDCSAGIDNGFAGVSILANQFITDALGSGELVVVLVAPGDSEGRAKGLQLLEAEAKGDAFAPLPSTLGVDGEPVSLVPDLVIDCDGNLRAGPGGTFVFPLPVVGVLLHVKVEDVSVTGTLGKDSLSLVLGGVLPIATLDAAIDGIPAENLGGQTHEQVKAMLGGLYIADLDTDGDGKAESMSIGLVFQASTATLAGGE